MTITHVLIVWILVTQRVTNNEFGGFLASREKGKNYVTRRMG